MLVNKAGRSERSVGREAEVRLCVHLMPSGEGQTTEVKDKGIKKMLQKRKYHICVRVSEKI